MRILIQAKPASIGEGLHLKKRLNEGLKHKKIRQN